MRWLAPWNSITAFCSWLALLIYLAQLLAEIGILISLFLGSFIGSALVNALPLTITIDVLTKRLPRWFVALPIVVYAGYGIVLAAQLVEMQFLQHVLAGQNAEALANPIDRNGRDLVFEGDGRELATRFLVPAVFQPAANADDWIRYEYAKDETCFPGEAELLGRELVPGWQSEIHANRSFGGVRACLAKSNAAPSGETLRIVNSTETSMSLSLLEVQRTSVRVFDDGDELASVTTALVKRIPTLPFVFVGCFLNSAAARWQCGAQLMNRKSLEIPVDGIRQPLNVSVVAGAMLNLEARSFDALSSAN